MSEKTYAVLRREYNERRKALVEKLESTSSRSLKSEVKAAIAMTDVCWTLFREMAAKLSFLRARQKLNVQAVLDELSNLPPTQPIAEEHEKMEKLLKDTTSSELRLQIEEYIKEIEGTLRDLQDAKSVNEGLQAMVEKEGNELDVLGQAIDTWIMQELAEGLVNLYAKDGKDSMYAFERTAQFLLEVLPTGGGEFVSLLTYLRDMHGDYTAKQHADADEYLFELEEYRRGAKLWAVMIQGALLSGHINESQALRNKSFALVKLRVENLEI